ncbi:DEAD/DEAH box helicase [Streptococcus ovuberis]|uniref:DEAD/DEAH box helicase n=1 Tax=Streptococcus ovuberis TaxID=1936207 RepID=A0A7X6MXW1_9STRE|nr:DEAD/DEAH box helicase [Streptococcus ovuberis]NKZ20355.1 DEAD/DEAH box helicase [Streptococcus ovuberis]
MENLDDYRGRLFVEGQLPESFAAYAETLPAVREEKGRQFCGRCGSEMDTVKCLLPIGATYCRECLLLGRVRSDQTLYHIPQTPFEPKDYLLWKGQLTAWQERISKGLLEAVAGGQSALVHAVTGAGKTEMIYQVVAETLAKGQAVCIATPRIDVCIELYRRLSQDFSCPIALLHGEGDPYFRTPLVIATTHQLLKFYQAFDLLIIDEVDAFPFVDNPMLYHAVNQSLTLKGCKLVLTATSTEELDRQVQKGELILLRLPRRFHENPLVVPRKVWLSGFQKAIAQKTLPQKLLKDIREQRQTGFPLLIFAPEITMGQALANCLESYFPAEQVGFVSSQTAERLEVVTAFREREVTILVSTTILERGVTFPCVDVFVVEANHRLYSKSSLVQIGGRVGRSLERPTGLLHFYQDGTNRAIEKAIAEIQLMNKESGLG